MTGTSILKNNQQLHNTLKSYMVDEHYAKMKNFILTVNETTNTCPTMLLKPTDWLISSKNVA